ncbi:MULTISPECIES: MerR family DNA-binding transcriptional regulator [Achromobacter]|uniref:MerR family DNA-binding transcriptional regulator n=1 Tax=Achromobacter TaxID=222 RepID=UPI00244C0F40|nr:MerR family DNA-binding transcriptional regulator [Achromobacter animicus]MDH0684828.1 MerR family DNA-binding transcriptional regulator [Achromobacter animicus]
MLARATSTNTETIRYYEREGLLPRPEQTARPALPESGFLGGPLPSTSSLPSRTPVLPCRVDELTDTVPAAPAASGWLTK